MKRLQTGVCLVVLASFVSGSVVSVAPSSPAAATVVSASECEKNGKASDSRSCTQGSAKKPGVRPSRPKGQAVGDCEALKGHLADAAPSLMAYRASAARWTRMTFVGKNTNAEEDLANTYVQQINAKFRSALSVSSFEENRRLLDGGIDRSEPQRSPAVGLARLFEDIVDRVTANANEGRC